jgi:hypothetical protein
MRGKADEIDQAMANLGENIAEQLTAAGWKRRLLHDLATATLTRPMRNGVIAVVEVERTSIQWPDDWPIEVQARLGVGYEPALNLMPLLTLRPRTAIIDSRHGRGNRFIAALEGLDDVTKTTRQIVDFVNEHAAGLAKNFPDAAAIDAELQRKIAASETPPDRADSDERYASYFDSQLRLVLLAAMGRHDETRVLLATYPMAPFDEPIDRNDRRFIRQLTRWLDAGGPVAPPVEDTLAQLSQPTRPPRPLHPSWSDARAKTKASKEALDAARTQSKGKSLDQLQELVAAEYDVRGIDIAPSSLGLTAEMLQLKQQPFGRARSALKTVKMLRSMGGDMIRLIKISSQDDPEWLQPPGRASYPMRTELGLYTPIELDAAAHDWLERVRAEAPRRIGPWVLVDVWLTRGHPAGALPAHIGEHHAGNVPEATASKFNQVMRAAALFDEDPFACARLTGRKGPHPAVLEVPLPEREATRGVCGSS